MQLRILHDTLYAYTTPVENAQHVAHLQPSSSATQTVHSFALSIDPEPTALHTHTDAFGNVMSHWTLHQAHQRLHVRASSQIHTQVLSAPEPASLLANWESVREQFRYRAGQSTDLNSQFVFASHHAPIDEAFAQFARPAFAPERSLVEAAISLMQSIYQGFTYASQSTDIHTPALQALQERRGVCQDFAHILIACLRSLGLPACYVSGYLLTHPPEGQKRLVGSDASHAWAAVYVPAAHEHASGGWLHLDPTNNRWGWGSPGEDYVLVAQGRDFADVSPLRGILQGGASHSLQVGVTVEPLEQTDPEESTDERLQET